jgi:UDP-N-acetylmuramoylalanine--D-glutamate ligase
MDTRVLLANLTGRRVCVVGLGTSGCAALRLLLAAGARVMGTDRAERGQLSSEAAKLAAQGIDLFLGGHAEVPFAELDLIVTSPGVPDFPELLAAEQRGVPVIGELELAYRALDVPVLAVGGTNGKSTATTLLGHMIESKYQRTFVGGNLGQPAAEAPGQGVDCVVWEVSSFQMERVDTFRPRVAILLNITEDHLDRYPGFDAYARAKGNCFLRQTPEDVAVIPLGDARCREQASRGAGRLVTFGPTGADYEVDGSSVVERSHGTRFDLSQTDLYGLHNFANAAAAIAAARAFGVEAGFIEEGLRRFRALPHRMALSGRFKGVNFYDDSKATNVGAAVTALLGLSETRGVLIAGGRDKLGSYDDLVAALQTKGRAVVLLGEAAARLEQAIGKTVPTERARTMEGAVLAAFRLAKAGDGVLLSPACSSLDMFKNYSERGDRFTEAVRRLPDMLAGHVT